MRKIYAFLFALLAVCGLANAQVVFDIANNPWNLPLGSGQGESAAAGNVSRIEQDDVVINLSLNAESGTPPRMWTGNQLRFYGNNVMEIVATQEIKSVTFTFTVSNAKDADGNSVNYLLAPDGSHVQSGASYAVSASSATFIAAHTGGHLRFSKIEVYFDGDTPGPGPGPDPGTIDWTSSATSPLTVAQALEKAAKLEQGADSGKEVFVKGMICKIEEISPKTDTGGYGNATYYISDDGQYDESAGTQLEVYRGFGLQGADFTSEDDIKVGDNVVVGGTIKNYNGTLEFTTGSKIYNLNGDTGPDTPTDEQTIAQVIAGGAVTSAATAGTVYAAGPNGFLIGDGTGYIYVFQSTAEVGDVVKVSGKVSEYGGCLQFSGATVTKTGTATVSYPEARVLDAAAFDALVAAPTVVYVKVKGTLNISGNYKNLTIEGATNTGSLQVTAAVLGDAATGNEVEVTGFFAYKSGSSTVYGNIIATKVEVLGGDVEPALELTSIANAKTAAASNPDGKDAVLKANDLLVTFVNGKNVYVFDGTDGLLLFANNASSNEGIKAGDKITADVKGQIKQYKGLTEMAVSEYVNLTVNSSNNAVTPQEVTIADITNSYADYENELVTIKDLTPAAEAWASKNITFVDDSDNELIVRDNFSTATALTFNTETTYAVTGFVSIFVDASGSTVQLFPRSAEDFDGEAVVYEPTGDGQLANAYTIEDVRHLGLQKPDQGAPIGWIKGYIVGYVNGQSFNNGIIFSANPPAAATRADDDPQVSNTNIVLADTPDCTDPSKCIPVQLSTKLGMREALSLRDNPGHLGKQVWINGTLTPYFSVAGVKDVVDWSFDGVTVTTGLKVVKFDTTSKDIYTVAGQRVSTMAQPGLYIVGGKKILVK